MKNKRIFTGVPRSFSDQEMVALFRAEAPTRRTIGSLVIATEVQSELGLALVVISLTGVEVGKRVLGFTNPLLIVDIANGDAAATGRIRLVLEDPPQFSSLRADISATRNGQVFPFKGDLASWRAEDSPAVGFYKTSLDARLAAYVTVRGASANRADFELRILDNAIMGMIATQLAPVQIYPRQVVAGDVHIAPGARITLAVPTPIGPGMLFLQCVFSTATTPETQVSSSVASIGWPGTESPGVLCFRGADGDLHG